MKHGVSFIVVGILAVVAVISSAAAPISVMILDGESGGTYHDWQRVTPALKKMLDETGLFATTVVTTPPANGDFTSFMPDFSKYQVVVMNYDAPDDRWPAALKTAFEQYVRNGGGFVSVHATDNAFPTWQAFNEMVGVGGWRGRREQAGPYWFIKDGTLVSDAGAGPAGSHGKRVPFQVSVRNTSHPITKGLPPVWMHQGDELYARLRGPGRNMTVLATAFSDPANNGSGRDEPQLMVLSYGKGRVFHTTMGHDINALSSVDFVVTLQRGTEWAATGQVESALTFAPTSTQTAAGLIVGTVPYMSPEQARGEQADFRSDQFALGVIVYELATGTHPFMRETPVQTLSAIIADEAPDPAQATPAVPVSMRWLIRRLLAKNPRQRYAHTADLAADLRTIREYQAEATSVDMVAPVIPPRSRWRLWAVTSAVVLAIAIIVAQALTPGANGVRMRKFTPFANDSGYQGAPAFSPDGTAIAYEAEVDGVVQIFTRKIGLPGRTRVTNTKFDCFGPVWSSDDHIYYHSLAGEKDALWRVGAVGGGAELVIEDASHSAISPDGKTVFFLRDSLSNGFRSELWFASPIDGTPQRYQRGEFKDLAGAGGFLRFSPDGSKLMVYLGQDPETEAGLWIIDTRSGQPRRWITPFTGPGVTPPTLAWLADNRHILVTRADGPTPGAHLWLADTESDVLLPVTTTPSNEGSPSVSGDGHTIAFTSEATDFDLFEVPLDGTSLRGFRTTTRNEFDPAVSPANDLYAYVTDRTGIPQIWIDNRDGYLNQPLVTEADFGGKALLAIGSLAFDPSGTKLAFQVASRFSERNRRPGARIWVTAVPGGGKPAQVGGAENYQDAPTWSPDGDWIAYLSGQVGDAALMKVQVGGRAAPVPLIKSGIPAFIARPQWSPDGKFVLCETIDGLTVVAADGTGSPQVIGTRGWFAYAWDKDSRRIYGLRATEDEHHFMLVSLDAQTGLERRINENLGTIPQALQPIRGFTRLRNDVFLTSVARVKSDIYLIEGFELPRRWWQRLFTWGGR